MNSLQVSVNEEKKQLVSKAKIHTHFSADGKINSRNKMKLYYHYMSIENIRKFDHNLSKFSLVLCLQKKTMEKHSAISVKSKD